MPQLNRKVLSFLKNTESNVRKLRKVENNCYRERAQLCRQDEEIIAFVFHPLGPLASQKSPKDFHKSFDQIYKIFTHHFRRRQLLENKISTEILFN